MQPGAADMDMTALAPGKSLLMSLLDACSAIDSPPTDVLTLPLEKSLFPGFPGQKVAFRLYRSSRPSSRCNACRWLERVINADTK
jgi:hypothetical protein